MKKLVNKWVLGELIDHVVLIIYYISTEQYHFCSTLSPFSQKLIRRLQESLAEYFSESSDDRLMAFGINPVLVHLGSLELIATLDDEFGCTDGTDLVNKSKELVKKRVLEMYKEKMAVSNNASAQSEGLFCIFDVSSLLFSTNQINRILNPGANGSITGSTPPRENEAEYCSP